MLVKNILFSVKSKSISSSPEDNINKQHDCTNSGASDYLKKCLILLCK